MTISSFSAYRRDLSALGLVLALGMCACRAAAPSPAAASPTALPADEQGGSLLPFDTQSLKDAFVFGAMAMGAVFVVVGIVFGIRRLF